MMLTCDGTLRGTPADDPWRAFPAVIAGITEETPGVATYSLELADDVLSDTYTFRPGQFNMLYLPGIGEAAISLSGRAKSNRGLLHTIRMAGGVTRTLAGLGSGGHLGLRGPFGSGWPMEDCHGQHVVVVAGGIGLAPLRPAIETVLDQPEQFDRLTVLSGARSPEHLLYQHQYPDWRAAGAVVDVTVDRSTGGWQGKVGVVPLLVDRMHLPQPENATFLICGPEVMMQYTVKAALQRGVAAEAIWLNMERNMNCAIGLCGHCQFGPEFICKDGPILSYDRLAPFLKVNNL